MAEETRKSAEAARSGDTEAFAAAFRALGRAVEHADGAQRRYGFTACGPANPAQRYGDNDTPGLSEDQKAGFSETKKAYLARADAICRAAGERIKPVVDEHLSDGRHPGEPGGWVVILDKLIPIFRESATALAALEVPPGDEGTLKSIAAQRSGVLQEMEALRKLAPTVTTPRDFNQRLLGFPALADALADAQRAYGFETCGAEPGIA